MKIRKMKRVTDWRQVRPDEMVVIVSVYRYKKEHRSLLPFKSIVRNGWVYMPVIVGMPYKILKKQIRKCRQEIIDRKKCGDPCEGINPENEYILIIRNNDYSLESMTSTPTMDEVVHNNMVFRWHKTLFAEFDERLLDIYLGENKEVFDMFDVTVGDLSTNN